MKNFCITLVLFCICFPVFSQQAVDENDDEHPQDDNNIYVINSFAFDIDGRTRPWALITKGELAIGHELHGSSALEKYIDNKTQLLINERVLEKVNITYTIEEPRIDGKLPVDLLIYVKDTWNIIALPRPKYSSSSGFDITLKARDFNFLGTMSPLRVDLGYRVNEKNQTYFNLMLDSDIPFRLFKLDWNFNFDNDFVYRPDREQPYYYKNVTGFSVEIPMGSTASVLTLGFNESFIYNVENSDSDKPVYGDFQEGLYLSSNPYISLKIPTGLEVYNFGELTYVPNISAVFNHELPQWPLKDNRNYPSLNFGHRLYFGQTDWIDNFRRGFSISASNTYSYYNLFKQRKDHSNALDAYLGITGTWHMTIDDIFGISTRLMYRQWFLTVADNTASVLRGILNKHISSDLMISLNFEIPMKLIKFRPTELFDSSKFRLFNFDLHFVPFIDAAVYRDPSFERKNSNYDFTYKNLLLTGGAEVIIFPIFFRSLFLRVSLGINLSTRLNLNTYELYIGTELHF